MNIFNQLIQIITLQRRPSDIDHSQTAVVLTFLATLVTGYLFTQAFLPLFSEIFEIPPQPSQQPWLMVVALLTQSGFLYLLLKYNDKENRIVQTLTALFGVSAILNFICFVSLQVPQLIFLVLVASGWNTYLMVVILSQAIECSLPKALLIIIAYVIIIDQLFALLIS